MKCSYCNIEMEKRRATEEQPYFYRLSGLDDLALVGIDVYTCPKCHAEAPIIPRVAQLHSAVADGLIRQPRMLKGSEIRFLRKHAGLPAREFAKLVGVSAEHLSRIENGHTESLGKPTDRLVRALTLTAKGGREARTTLLSIADGLKKGTKGGKREHASYALRRQGWRRQSA
jgi:transcriptional regulator with XRE-family HTH domain